MKSRKNLYQQDLKPPGTFLDVVACFSEFEWKLLHEWQNELFNNVMKEIHQAVTSLGPVIASSVFALRSKENEHRNLSYAQDLERRNDSHVTSPVIASSVFSLRENEHQNLSYGQDLERKNDSHVTRFPALNDDILRMEQDVEVRLAGDGTSKGEGRIIIPHSAYPVDRTDALHKIKGDDNRDTDRTQNNNCPSTGPGTFIPVTSFRIIQEEEKSAISHQHSGTQDTSIESAYPVDRTDALHKIKSDDNRDTDRTQNNNCPSTGPGTFISVTSLRIIQEEEKSAISHQHSGTQDISIESGQADNSEAISFRIKEEGDADFMCYQDPTVTDHMNVSRGVTTSRNTIQNQQESHMEGASIKSEGENNIVHKGDVTQHHSINPENSMTPHTHYENGFPLWSPRLKRKRNHKGKKMQFVVAKTKQTINEWTPIGSYQNMQTESELYICRNCGNCFQQSLKGTVHHQSNLEMQPNTCNDCEKSFLRLTNLNNDQGEQMGEKPHKCTDCGKSFRIAQSLLIHRRVHTGEKPYTCNQCGKDFRQIPHLVKHQRRHTGEKPYVCIVCEKGFINSSNLKRHQQIHTRELSIP